jgi:hypothetical protein
MSSPLKLYDSAQSLIALHVPRTGGTSFRSVLAAWFGDDLHLHYRRGRPLPRRVALGSGSCLYGHFNALRGFGIQTYYPEARQCIVMLRDPYARFVSQWRFLNQRKQRGVEDGLDDVDPNLERWIHRRVEDMARGCDSYSFLCHFPRELTRDNFAAVLDEYFVFVAILERVGPSLTALAKALGRQPMEMPHVNVSAGESYPEYRGFHEAHFALEHELYAYCLQLNARLIDYYC